jgi:hypothetical protein
MSGNDSELVKKLIAKLKNEEAAGEKEAVIAASGSVPFRKPSKKKAKKANAKKKAKPKKKAKHIARKKKMKKR